MYQASKRKCDTLEAETKRTRSLLSSEEADQWPVYVHPEGGTVKFSPWGSIREWVDPVTGQAGCKFEDTNFLASTFDTSITIQVLQKQKYELPTTPLSLGGTTPSNASPTPPDRIQYSPSSEAEQYVVEGYSVAARKEKGRDRYVQEQENYFGMGEYEDYSENGDVMMA